MKIFLFAKVDEPLVKQVYKATNYKKNEYRYELRLIYHHRLVKRKRLV